MSLLMLRCLGNNVEVHIKEPISLNALKKPLEWYSIYHIKRLHFARGTSEHTTNIIIDVSDN